MSSAFLRAESNCKASRTAKRPKQALFSKHWAWTGRGGGKTGHRRVWALRAFHRAAPALAAAGEGGVFTAVSLPVVFRDFLRQARPGGETVSRGYVQRGQ